MLIALRYITKSLFSAEASGWLSYAVSYNGLWVTRRFLVSSLRSGSPFPKPTTPSKSNKVMTCERGLCKREYLNIYRELFLISLPGPHTVDLTPVSPISGTLWTAPSTWALNTSQSRSKRPNSKSLLT